MSRQEFAGYEAAIDRVAFLIQTEAGYLRVSGPDQSTFLQRQTTNDLELLQPQRALLTVLTSPTARILDVFYLLRAFDEAGEQAIDAITLPGRGAETSSFLKSRIFFMDKVTVQDMSLEIVQIDLIGPQASALLERLGAEQIPAKDAIVSIEVGTVQVRLLSADRSFGLGYRLLVPVQGAEKVLATLRENGAVQLAPESYLVLRVEAGQPEADYELTDNYTPLETGLQAAVADNKGCYTGQEIIARQITYDKITQSLCGLSLEKTCNAGERVWVEGKAVGTITSSVWSPRFGFIALGVLKRPYHAPGTQVQVGNHEDQSKPALVSSLPFQTRPS